MSSTTCFDIIGDIHGQYGKLRALMERLGYTAEGVGFTPPKGHRAIFLGDLIDPKPGSTQAGGVRATLEAVKAMCDAGDALCIMGNHEFNAIYFHSKDASGQWLRTRSTKNTTVHQGTLDDFPDHEQPDSTWQRIWLPWMKTLPFHIELPGFRAIHATWRADLIERISGRDMSCTDFFHAAVDPGTPEGEAMEILLKGLEIQLPEGSEYEDHTGVIRRRMRARWWTLPSGEIHYDQLVYPDNPAAPAKPVPAECLGELQGYGEDEPPVFFGHYLKPATHPPAPERHNVACLDYSAAKSGPLVAYRWQGEARLKPEHYVVSGPR